MVFQQPVLARTVLAQASEPMPLWRVLFWCAVVASVLAVLYLWRLARRQPRLSGVRAAAALLVVVSLWGAFRVTSNHRWQVNGLTNDAIDLFELTDTGEVRKGLLLHEGPCGLRDVAQSTTLVGVAMPAASGPGRDRFEAQVLELAEQTAMRLETDGWTVSRYETNALSDDGQVVDELLRLRIDAQMDQSFVQIRFGKAIVDIDTYTSECLANHFRFGNPSESRSRSVAAFNR